MLISYSHNFIFIHIPKSAGTSIASALEPYKTHSAKEDDRLHQHFSALQISQEISSEVYELFIKFAFIRNPWSLIVSLYHYILRSNNHPQHVDVKSLDNFDDFVQWALDTDQTHTPPEKLCCK